jgi:hypothetical protein
MRLGINLRGDLAKLSDAEITSKFDSLLAERNALYSSLPGLMGNKWLYQKGLGLPLGRGPFHGGIFYKIAGLCYGGSSLGDLYELDCELKDVRDEIQRRVDQRKARAELR